MSQEKVLRIFAQPSNDGAIGHLRILEPCQMMGELGLVETVILDNQKPIRTATMVEMLKNTDIVWFQACMDQKYMWNILNCRQVNPKIKLVMDVDDNLFAVNPWNPSYTAFTTDEKYEGQEHVVALPKQRNHARIRIFQTLMKEADAIITTTELLAAVYSQLNKNIYIMPNRLIMRNWDFSHIPKINDGKIRLSWMGGSSHMMDWAQAHGAIKRIIEKRDNIIMQFHTSPEAYIDFIRDLGKEKTELWNWIDYSGHSFKLNCTKPDIGIIPLNDDEFSICKSDLKFIEYAMLKVPCVCQNIPPYSKSVTHGVNGFLANNDEEFEKCIELLIGDEDLRRRIGEAAYAWAKRERNAEEGAREVYEMMKSIMELPSWQIMPEIKYTEHKLDEKKEVVLAQ